MERLSTEYKKITNGGKYNNNIGREVLFFETVDYIKQHKFHIAMENSRSEGYCTEKINIAYMGNAIPIYWGDTAVEEYFNIGSFVHVKDMDTAIK